MRLPFAFTLATTALALASNGCVVHHHHRGDVAWAAAVIATDVLIDFAIHTGSRHSHHEADESGTPAAPPPEPVRASDETSTEPPPAPTPQSDRDRVSTGRVFSVDDARDALRIPVSYAEHCGSVAEPVEVALHVEPRGAVEVDDVRGAGLSASTEACIRGRLRMAKPHPFDGVPSPVIVRFQTDGSG